MPGQHTVDIDLNNHACLICGHTSHSLIYPDHNIYRCTSCGLMFVYPVPSQGELNEWYRKDFLTKDEMLRNVSLRYFDREIKLLRKLKPSGNLLDVGCATGRFLEQAQSCSWKCYGVEISELAGRYVADKLGIDVRIGDLKESGFSKEFFDIITLHHLIEHMSDPLSFIRDDVKPFLKKNGILVIEVPNARGRQTLINGSDWKQISEKAHLYHFTPPSLRSLVSAAGYKQIDMFSLSDPRFGFFDSLRLFGVKDRWIEKMFGRLKQQDSAHAGLEELYNLQRKTGILRSLNRIIFYPVVRFYELINMECMLFIICTKKE